MFLFVVFSAGVTLRLRGDGQRYKFILRTDQNWDTVTYCQSFDTEAGEWQDVQLPFDKFIPVFRARSLSDGDPLNSSNIVSLQVIPPCAPTNQSSGNPHSTDHIHSV
jgi:hypothetical protein